MSRTEFNLYGVKRTNSYGEFFTNIGLNINHKYAWGIKDDEPIYDITFDIDGIIQNDFEKNLINYSSKDFDILNGPKNYFSIKTPFYDK